jgi:hypothetical protein
MYFCILCLCYLLFIHKSMTRSMTSTRFIQTRFINQYNGSPWDALTCSAKEKCSNTWARFTYRLGKSLIQGFANFPKIHVASRISRCQKRDMKQVSYGVPTNIKRHPMKFSLSEDLAPRIYAVPD